MNEADTRAKPIEPALRAAGWGAVEGSLICREVIAPGRLQGAALDKLFASNKLALSNTPTAQR